MNILELTLKGATKLDFQNILNSKIESLNKCKEYKNPPPFVVGGMKKLQSEITLFTNHIKNI